MSTEEIVDWIDDDWTHEDVKIVKAESVYKSPKVQLAKTTVSDTLEVAKRDKKPNVHLAETLFVENRFDLIACKINTLQELYFESHKLPPMTQHQAFITYFSLSNTLWERMLVEGQNAIFFEMRLDKISFQHKMVQLRKLEPASYISEGLQTIYYYVYFQYQWNGDLSTQWAIRLSGPNSKTTFRNLIGYINLIRQGIFEMSSNDVKKQKDQTLGFDSFASRVHPKIAFSCLFLQPLDDKSVIGSAVVPNRFPVPLPADQFPRHPVTQEPMERVKDFDLIQSVIILDILSSCEKRPKFEDFHNTQLPVDEQYQPFLRTNLRTYELSFELFTRYNQFISRVNIYTNDYSVINTKGYIETNQRHNRFASKRFCFFHQPTEFYRRHPTSRHWVFLTKAQLKVLGNQPLTLELLEKFRDLQNLKLREVNPEWKEKFIIGTPIASKIFEQEQASQAQFEILHLTAREYVPFSDSSYAIYTNKTNLLKELNSRRISQKLGTVLKLIPTLNVQLNAQQLSVLHSDKNMFVLGRSGTGKTTTTVLRFFCQEIMFTAMRKQHVLNTNEEYKSLRQVAHNALPQLASWDLAQETGIKMVFVTASPVLTNEVKSYYTQLKEKLRTHLIAKEKRQEKKHLGLEFFGDETVEVEDEKKHKILQYIEMKEKEILANQQVESQFELPESFADLKPHHFPLFITVQKLVYMIDAAMPRSFFTRDSSNKILGLDSNLGWHREEKGVFMINQSYKQKERIINEVKEFEMNVLSKDKTDEVAATKVPEEEVEIESKQTNFLSYGGLTFDKAANFSLTEHLYNKKEGHVRQGSAFKQHKIVAKNYQDKKRQRKTMEDTGLLMNMAFEITLEIFEERFLYRWRTVMSHKLVQKLSANFLWTEIMTVIKGSVSNKYAGSSMSRKDYTERGSADLSDDERRTVYWIYLQYETWKLNVGGFDFLDVIQHIRSVPVIEWYFRWKTSIDFLIVDEVQDLNPKTLQMLYELTTHQIVFAGDSAQTIAKGVNTRVTDLAHAVDFKETPPIQSLTINYRSQNNILQLANSVVTLIELLFPKSIDRMTQEVSAKEGPKPFIIPAQNDRGLIEFFFGKGVKEEDLLFDTMQVDPEGEIEAPTNTGTPHFGANQVVIVRDQQAKQDLPPYLKNMLVLTVYESKGLEFDDVILFNFFANSYVKNLWKILQNICIKHKKTLILPKHLQEWEDDFVVDSPEFDEYIKEVKAFERRKRAVLEGSQEILEGQFEIDLEAELQFLNNDKEITRRFGLLCTELKFLYVAITRPKNRLFIYDDNCETRKFVEKLWRELNLVQNAETSQEAGVSVIQSVGVLHQETHNVEEWRIQGIRFLQQRYYDQAIKCFSFSSDPALVVRCRAFQKADEAQDMMNKADQLIWKVSNSYFSTKRGKKDVILEIKELKSKSYQTFFYAGRLFEKAGFQRYAGSCYFTARAFSRAANVYKEAEAWAQAGESLLRCGKEHLREAAQLLERGNMLTRAIECFEQLEDWEGLLYLLHRCQDQLDTVVRQALVSKYVPIALNSLYNQFTQNPNDPVPVSEASNIGQAATAKIRKKYEVKHHNVIREEDELQDEYGEEIIFSEEEDSDAPAEESNEQIPDTVQQDSKKPRDKIDLSSLLKKSSVTEGENEVPTENVSGKKDLADLVGDLENEEDEEDDLEAGLDLENAFKLKHKSSLPEEDVQSQGGNASGQSSFEVIGSDEEQASEGEQKAGKTDQKEALKARLKLNESSFEHLSQFDPDDQFLKSNRSVSIIESIMSRNSKKNQVGKRNDSSQFEVLSATSEFSIISNGDVLANLTKKLSSASEMSLDKTGKSNSNFQMDGLSSISVIEKQEDNYATDILAQKVIYFMSLWSEDMLAHLEKLRDKGILKGKAEGDKIDEEDFLIQMDEVDQDFVTLVLDTLEVYEFYHMALMLCKRYHLSSRQGKYLVLMCSKYSNLNTFRIDYIRTTTIPELRTQQREVSILAHEAIHNVLTLCDSAFLDLKPFNTPLTPENSLGVQTYELLFHLGFWKKLVYIMEMKTSLHLCLKFQDATNFSILLRGFLSTKDRAENEQLLANWGTKSQLMGFRMAKDRLFSTEFNEESDFLHVTNQLLQMPLFPHSLDLASSFEALKRQQSLISDYFILEKEDANNTQVKLTLLQKSQAPIKQSELDKERIALEIAEKKADQQQVLNQLSSIVVEQIKVLQKKSTREQKYAASFCLFDLLFSQAPHTLYQTAVIHKISDHFTDHMIAGQLFDILLRCCTTLSTHIQQNCSLQRTSEEKLYTNQPELEALFANLLVSHLENEDIQSETPLSVDLLSKYQDSHMLVHRNSVLTPEINLLQQFVQNAFMYKMTLDKYATISKNYYNEVTVKSKLQEAFNKAKSFLSINRLISDQQFQNVDMAFMIDLDAQYSLVPIEWVRSLVLRRMIRTCIHLLLGGKTRLNEKNAYRINCVAVSSVRYNRIHVIGQLLHNIKPIYLTEYFKVEEWLKKTSGKVHQVDKLFANRLFAFQNSKKGMLYKVQLEIFQHCIKHVGELVSVEQSQNLDFGFGCFANNEERFRTNRLPPIQIVRLGFDFLRKAFVPDLSGWTNLATTDKLDYRNQLTLENLLCGLQLFQEVDSSVLYLEFCRRVMHINKPSYEMIKKTSFEKGWIIDGTSQQFRVNLGLMKSVLLSLKASKYLKSGYLTKAANLMLTLTDAGTVSESKEVGYKANAKLARFPLREILNFEERFNIIEHSSILALLVRFGKIYAPDYALRFLDRNQFDEQYANKTVIKEPTEGKLVKVGKNDEHYYFDHFEGEGDDYGEEQNSRELLNFKWSQKPVQKSDAETIVLVEKVLQYTVEFLQELNKDLCAFEYKQIYLRCFNLLMTVTVNDTQKTSKVVYLLGSAFNLLLDGPFDDVFKQMGWGEVNLSDAQELSKITKDFAQSEDGLKWEFFSDAYGQDNVMLLDIKECQKLEMISEKSIEIAELKNLAQRMNSASKIRRAWRRYTSNRRTGQLESRQAQGPLLNSKLVLIARRANILCLLTVQQIKIKAVVNLFAEIHKKEQHILEMVLSKKFKNSVDINSASYFLDLYRKLQLTFAEEVRAFVSSEASTYEEFEVINDDDPFAERRESMQLRRSALDEEFLVWQLLAVGKQAVEQEEIQTSRMKLKWQKMSVLFTKQLKRKNK